MQVVACLPPILLSHLRVVLARGHSVVPVEDSPALWDAVRHQPVDVAVLDPRVPGISTVDIRAISRQHPSLPLVVYTTLGATTMSAVVELARHGIEHIVLHRFDDAPRRFLALLERLPAYALGDRLLSRLGTPLATLPPATAQMLQALVREPTRFRDTRELAAGAGVDRRTLYRQCEAAGLATPRMLLRGARLLRAYAYLRDPGVFIEDVAVKLGYSEPRRLSQHMQDAVGLKPTELRRMLAPDDFVALLASRLWLPRD